MFLSNLKHRKGGAVAVAALMALTLSSCDSSFVYEDLRPCVPDYRVRLSSTYNLTGVEKVSEVEGAEVYAFDKEGNFVTSAKADKQSLIDNDFTISLPLERFQEYDLVVWGGLTDESPFKLDGTRAVSSKDDLTCRLTTSTDSQGRETSEKKFPGLYHSNTSVSYTVEDGVEERIVPLVKNTNMIDVLIRSERGEDVVSDNYTVEIIDANEVMSHDNSVSGKGVVYLPYKWVSGEYPISDGEGGYSDEASKAVVAEIHYGRLMADSEAEIVVKRNDTGQVLFKKNLIELFQKLKKRILPNMDMQEYLDRQDYYRIDLVLTTHVSLYINGWRIIYNNMEWD